MEKLDLRRRYKELLQQFCENKLLKELLNECIIDDIRVRENYHTHNNKYPEKRDLLHKLISDLEVFEQTIKGGK